MVNIIKTPDTYQCQICGETYEYLWQAELCERQPIGEVEESLLGAEVIVRTRYDGLINTHITGFRVEAKYSRAIKTSQTLDKYLQKFFKDLLDHHERVFLISEELQMGKSEFRNWVYESEVSFNGSTI